MQDDPVSGEKSHAEYDLVREIMSCGANIEETAAVLSDFCSIFLPLQMNLHLAAV